MTARATILDHPTAERLAAATIDGFLVPEESARLEEHVRGCSACRARLAGFRADASALRHLDLGDAPATTRARVAIQAGKALERSGGLGLGRGTALVAAAALLIVALGATALGGVGGRGGTAGGPETSSAPSAGPAVVFQDALVQLTAAEFWIDTPSGRFVGADQVTVSSDPGNERYRTLELTWFEHDREMRLNLYFAALGNQWWVNEIRTYDGEQSGDWVTIRGQFFTSPMGAPWTGDVDIGLTDSMTGARTTLHMADMTLAVQPFVPPRAPGPNDAPNSGAVVNGEVRK